MHCWGNAMLSFVCNDRGKLSVDCCVHCWLWRNSLLIVVCIVGRKALLIVVVPTALLVSRRFITVKVIRRSGLLLQWNALLRATCSLRSPHSCFAPQWTREEDSRLVELSWRPLKPVSCRSSGPLTRQETGLGGFKWTKGEISL